MPIYEYSCQACGHPFEALVFGSETPECPACGSTKLEKQLSVFGVGESGGGGSAPGCAPAGGG